MLKLSLAAALIAVAMPAMADDMMMKCDDATVMKMDKDVDGMSDMAMKDMAMKEMTMAKDAMKMGDMDMCKTHMEKAHKTMM